VNHSFSKPFRNDSRIDVLPQNQITSNLFNGSIFTSLSIKNHHLYTEVAVAGNNSVAYLAG
jgi:hypothetical protein